MARPEKNIVDKKTHRLPHVRCTEDEGMTIRQKAAALGMSVSDYIRHVALSSGTPGANDNKQSDPVSILDDKLVYELHRIGNNLNQLTKKYHSHNIEPPGLRSLFPVLERLLTHVFKHINVE